MSKTKTKKKATFVELIDRGDHGAIVELAAQHRSKRHNFTFAEPLKNLSEEDLVKVMKQLLEVLMEYIKKSLDGSAVIDWTKIKPELCKSIGQFIQATTDIGIACIQSELTIKCRLELVKIAVFLHAIMLSIPNNMDYVKNFIALYCEKLYLTELIGNTEILHNVILYLVQKSLVKKAIVHLKRLCALRKVFGTIMKKGQPRAVQLWSLFKECSRSQFYLENTEGQKVLGCIMALDEDKLLDMHKEIRDFVPRCRIMKKAIGYGQVYFEAWCYTLKHDDERVRECIELNCLQDFIKMGIQKTDNILPVIRKILNPFFIHKKQPEICQMLYGMVQPVIWLFLKNPNGWYRAAAAQFFFDVFPLEDPELRVVNNDQEVTEQLIMIQELLKDDFPIVRMTAVLGVCVSMSVNWEVFPEEMVKTIFRIIVNDLSRDSASPEVRVAVVKGLRCLLENPLTVRCLVKVLPKLAGLFHDVAEEVRIAFCQLLLRVKTIFTIKYFDIVSPPHLFARLEEDSRAVQKCLSHLLHNSYFPKNQDLKVWLGRALEIIKVDRCAARVFFSYATSFLGVEKSVKFILQATRTLHFYIQTKSASCHMDMEISDKENIQSFTDYLNTLEEAVGFNDLNIVAGLMEAIICMWISLKPDQQGNKDCMKMLVQKTSLPLQEISIYYKDTIAWEPIFYVSSFLPVIHMPGLSSLCFVKLQNLPPDAQEAGYLTLLECLMNHCQGVALIKMLKDWIEVDLNDSYIPPPAKKRRGRKKNSEIIQRGPTKSRLANRMLDTMLMRRNLQKRIIVEKEALQEILDLTDIIKRNLETANHQCMSEEEADFLNLLLYNIMRFAVHMHGVSECKPIVSVPMVNDLVEWAGKKLVKHIAPIDGDQNHFTLLVFRICENLSKLIGDVYIGDCFEPTNSSYLDFIMSLLDTDFADKYLSTVAKVFHKHVLISQCRISEYNDYMMFQIHLRYLKKLIVLLDNEALLVKLTDKVHGEVTLTLGHLIPVIFNYEHNYLLVSEIFNYILKTILNSAADKSEQQLVRKRTKDPFAELSFPKIGNFYWSVVSAVPEYFGLYIKLLTDMVKKSKNIRPAMWIAYWMMIWGFMQKFIVDKSGRPVLRDAYNLAVQLEECLPTPHPITKGSKRKPSESVMSFQRHCHGEVGKLKKCIREIAAKAKKEQEENKKK